MKVKLTLVENQVKMSYGRWRVVLWCWLENFVSWDNIKFEVYTICRISFPMVLKICLKKMYDRNLSTRLSQVKISYGGWKGLLWYWLGWKFQKKSIFQNVNISDLAFSRVEQVILLYKGAKNSHWVV